MTKPNSYGILLQASFPPMMGGEAKEIWLLRGQTQTNALKFIQHHRKLFVRLNLWLTVSPHP